MYRTNLSKVIDAIMGLPDAEAYLQGNAEHRSLWGAVRFFDTDGGVVVTAELFGLPRSENDNGCERRIFGFHIHEGNSCGGENFSLAGTHYNPGGCAHPYHAGDLPPIFGSHGVGFSIFLTDEFTVDEIIGRTLMLHSGPDDFTTQPSGNSGSGIACGEIRGIKRK